MRALVTDVHVRSGVAGLRALGRAGIEVVALGPRRSAAGLWSRHGTVQTVGPDVSVDADGFAAAVVRGAERYGPLVVYPGQEASIDAVVEASSRTTAALLPYPGAGELEALRDKSLLPPLAEEAGLTAPRTLVETTPAELDGRRLPMPCVVKRTRLGGHARARMVQSPGELRAMLGKLPRDERVLIQQRVRGPLIGLAIVVDRSGGVVARLQQLALRTWPEAGGSSLAVSTAPDEKLTQSAARLLSSVGYWGLAQLQFIETDREYVLIDVNTRFYGSMPLALASGVNLAAAWHAVVVDSPRPATPSGYRTGVSYRSLRHELAAAVHGSPGLLLRRAPRPTSGALWARDDPVPSALLTAQTMSAPLGRRLLRRISLMRPRLTSTESETWN
jgi:predicted ATP-grasp superfamily ATP-dependent carboligase